MIGEFYVNLNVDLGDALRYYNENTPLLNDKEKKWIADHFDFEIDEKHRRATDKTIEDLRADNELYDEVLRAASISSFLG